LCAELRNSGSGTLALSLNMTGDKLYCHRH
jgi:hypothetical protein